MRSAPSTIRRPNRTQRESQGYILITLLLLVTLLTVAAAIAAPVIAFQIKRDQESELIHRGVQYSRAIKLFAKKNGRYPLTLDQLRGDVYNRYLRKPYKDPVTGRDFRLLHQGDIYAAAAASAPKLNAAPSDDNAGPDPSTTAADSNAATLPTTSFGFSANRGNSQSTTGSMLESDNSANTVGQVIFGVASRSKRPTIREFSHKNHYNQWFFFYDPNYDRGTEITGPTSLVPVAAQALASASPNPMQSQNPQLLPVPPQQPATAAVSQPAQ